MRPRTTTTRVRASRPGFTLLETGMALVVITVGVVAMIDAQRSFIMSNAWSSHEATATYLAGEIRERMRTLTRHDPVSGLVFMNGAVVGLGREAGEVTVNDLDDVDDYHEIELGEGGNFDGPIDAFGRVIPEVDPDGNIRIDTQTGLPVPLQGWTQAVTVEKINPYDFSAVLPWEASQAPSGNGAFPGRTLDRYPLKVTVIVSYMGPYDAEPREVVSVSWIVPDNQ